MGPVTIRRLQIDRDVVGAEFWLAAVSERLSVVALGADDNGDVVLCYPVSILDVFTATDI